MVGTQSGAYLPLRKILSPAASAAGAFLMSGLLHELVLSIIALKAKLNPAVGRGFEPRYGNHLLFFALNGILIALEFMFRGHPIFKWASKPLPQPIQTCLVLMMVLPFSHIFTDEYLRSGFYQDFALSIPTITKL